RLEASGGTVAQSEITQAKGVLTKLAAQEGATRQLLQAQGLTSDQIDDVARTGEFIRRVVIRAPSGRPKGQVSRDSAGDAKAPYEVQDLKVQLGDQVKAGQVLAVLANHRLLFIEGRAFSSELPRIEEAAREGHPVQVEAPGGRGDGWETL